MKMLKILRYLCAALLLSSGGMVAQAQQTTADAPADSLRDDKAFRGLQYASREEAAAALLKKNDLPLLAGFSVSVDVAGAVMAAVGSYGQFEGACRVNLRGRYFPVAEVGWGMSDHTSDATDVYYKTSAPYFRLGCDYNVARDKSSGNRIFVGARYAFSAFDYDFGGPDVEDPNYGTTLPASVTGVKGRVQWAEAVFGLEAKVWGPLSLGWSIRYKFRLGNKRSAWGDPWYVPGYGKNGGSVIGGTFNVGLSI